MSRIGCICIAVVLVALLIFGGITSILVAHNGQTVMYERQMAFANQASAGNYAPTVVYREPALPCARAPILAV